MTTTSAATERRRDVGTAALTGGIIVVIGFAIKLADPLFSFWGDNAESFAPLWHHLGTQLRQGNWILIDPHAWTGGNYVAEAAYGVMNPVSLANFVLLSFFDDLARGMFVVMLEFLALLGIAIFLLARSYEASRPLAVAFAVAVPFGGFTLFYGAYNWASGLMALTWVIWFWWAARLYTCSRLNPFVAFAFGALAISVGNPYAILGILTTLTALAVDLAVRRNWRRLGGLIALGACVGAVAALIYLPLTYTLAVTGRQESKFVSNDGYLTPDLQDLAGMSSPSGLPSIQAWYTLHDYVPSAYFVWFAAPLLPWIRWRTATRNWRTLVGPLTFLGLMLLLTVGPSKIWLFRWPLRLVEYVWCAVAVILAVMLSHGRARSYVRARWILSATIVAFGFYLAWAVTPDRWIRHALTALGIGSLVALALYLWRRRGLWTATAVLIAGIAVVAPLQVHTFGWNTITVRSEPDVKAAHDLNRVQDSTADYRGRVLQLGAKHYIPVEGDVSRSGRINFGNTTDAIGLDSLIHYTGIGFPEFQQSLCMNYQGSSTCYVVWERLLEPVGPAYDTPLVDALGVDTIVYSTHTFDTYALTIPDGWETVLRDEDRFVVSRPTVSSHPTVTPSRDVTVTSASEAGTAVRFSTSSEEGGTVLLDRLAWPGYTATTADGSPLAVNVGPSGLLEVSVPPGHTDVKIDFEIPGLRQGAAVAAAAALGAAIHGLMYALRGRRRSTVRHAITSSSSRTI